MVKAILIQNEVDKDDRIDSGIEGKNVIVINCFVVENFKYLYTGYSYRQHKVRDYRKQCIFFYPRS